MLASKTCGSRKPFKVWNVLTKIPSFTQTVDSHWAATDPVFLLTSSFVRFSKKIKTLKPLLRGLGKTHLSDLTKRTKEAHDQLCVKQKETLIDPKIYGMEEESEAYKWWQHLELEEGYLKQKSKLHWLNVGDRNNTYFYKTIQTRQMQNAIKEIRSNTWERLTKSEDIKAEAELYFREFLTLKLSEYRGMGIEQLEEILPFCCTDFYISHLRTEKEIKKIIWNAE